MMMRRMPGAGPLAAPPLALLTATAVQWRAAGRQVRLCVHPDEPRLVERYLRLGQALYAHSLTTPWDIAEAVVRLLLDTAADRALPMRWRTLCVDYVCRPLIELARLADTAEQQQQLAALRWRLARLDLDPGNSLYPGNEEAGYTLD